MEEHEESMRDADFRLKRGLAEHPFRFWSISIGSSILSSPFIKEGRIFFGCNDTHVYSLDTDGNKLWSFRTNDSIFSSPTCYGDTVVVGSNDKFLYAFSADGELKWRFPAGDKVTCTPVIVDGVVYFGSNNGIFYALSVEDGKELWKFFHSSDIFFMSPAVVNDSIISGHMSGDIFCLSKDGELLWNVKTGGHTLQTPLVVDKFNNELSCFAKRSFSSFPKGRGCMALVGSADGYFRCIDSDSGKVKWEFYSGLMGSSSPTAYNNTVFFGSFNGKLYAIDTDGKIKWTFQTGNRIVPSPAIYRGDIYFGSSDHNLYAIDAKDGGLKWRFLTDDEIVSSPMAYGDAVFFGSWDGHMYAISLWKKELLWKFRTAFPGPSYIKKPTIASESSEPPKFNLSDTQFTETATTKGYNAGGAQYSAFTGERTNVFYGSPVSYRRKKSYDDERHAYQ